MAQAAHQAAEAFESELLEMGVEPRNAEEAGRRAAIYLASDEVWRGQLGPLLTTRQVADLAGTTKQAVSELARRKRLVALPTRQGPPLFPAFQFGPNGRSLDGIAAVIEILEPHVETPYTIASFLSGTQPELRGKTPAEWLRARKPVELVAVAARRLASELSR
jgi:hypothetical protein